MAAKYKFILENEVISSTKGALVVVTAYIGKPSKMILEILHPHLMTKYHPLFNEVCISSHLWTVARQI